MNLSLETAVSTFIRWTEHLLQRHRVKRNFNDGSLYDLTRLTATMLDRALGRQASLSKSTRIRKPRGKGKVHTSKADKQSLRRYETRLGRVTERAGVSVGSLYKYYSKRHDYYLAYSSGSWTKFARKWKQPAIGIRPSTGRNERWRGARWGARSSIVMRLVP